MRHLVTGHSRSRLKIRDIDQESERTPETGTEWYTPNLVTILRDGNDGLTVDLGSNHHGLWTFTTVSRKADI